MNISARAELLVKFFNMVCKEFYYLYISGYLDTISFQYLLNTRILLL